MVLKLLTAWGIKGLVGELSERLWRRGMAPRFVNFDKVDKSKREKSKIKINLLM